MCFENLPIEFDEGGKARLKEGVADICLLGVRLLAGAVSDPDERAPRYVL